MEPSLRAPGSPFAGNADVSEWFFTSDLHGQSDLYEQAVATVAARRPRALVLGGDLAPHDTTPVGVQRQRVFLEGFFVEFARRVREAVPGIEILVLMGNDDWRANHDCLERRDGELWRAIHGRMVEVDGVRVAGSSWVPITPFGMKDWERWEDGGEESPPRLDGLVSEPGGLVPFAFDPARRSPTIAEALEALAAHGGIGDAVLISHSPPRDTHCDMVGGGAHVGSRALRRFIEAQRPRLVLSGHIHESPRVSRAYRDAIGTSIIVNPGQFGVALLSGVWFDPERIESTLRHTVHG